ncbi:saccharopine dehydrogenase NADP-binding domain-containing protein [Chryseosolibacter indicus]|uniref:Saccharopine dehydrogenase NADP-binding domain-containing protein n=1 Tax=Chryseosolibacter indicus TaxID=2782351 RepID=A0ABS5VU30_9BACT|nr:saccharopine dehydrogenase NADP-binding domain-containing protein [Chryseosolibacter indicus]MBT1704934.1 saccharopine dehydrogenase NADP-binding domain-containing protein [Chryseosolibacter indicus]
MTSHKIAVYGAYGHTAGFVIDSILHRGWTPVLVGRNHIKLSALKSKYPQLEIRVAEIETPKSLDNAFKDTIFIINCAGPFLDTAFPLIESALRLSIHYIDLSAEQKSVLDVFEFFSEKAAKGDSMILPGLAFYGGLADLLASAAVAAWDNVDNITIAIGLSFWQPTLGTRLTGQRNHYPRLIYSKGRLQPKEDNYQEINWNFPPPLNAMKMTCLPFSEIITISKHIRVSDILTYFSTNALEDIRNKDTPPPMAVDTRGRSAQEFRVDVIATRGIEKRIARAGGRDIYAVTAVLVIEAVDRIMKGKTQAKGVSSAGHVFNACDFLKSLSSDDIEISLD